MVVIITCYAHLMLRRRLGLLAAERPSLPKQCAATAAFSASSSSVSSKTRLCHGQSLSLLLSPSSTSLDSSSDSGRLPLAQHESGAPSAHVFHTCVPGYNSTHHRTIAPHCLVVTRVAPSVC